jgi:predicted phosphodiesterase
LATELPRNGTLLALAQKFSTDQALADHLRVPRTTLRDHIYRLGMREAINAARELPDAEEPVELPLIQRNYSDQDRHYLYAIGDVHIGAKSHHARAWQKWLNFLYSKENASLLGTGDFLNTAILGSKSDVYDEKMTVGEAKRLLIEQLRPLAEAGRIDALMPGNHEDRITRSIGDCPIRDVADALSVPYIEAAGMFLYQVGEVQYRVFLRHGTGNGQSMSALTKSRSVIPADVYLTGHTHRQQVLAEDIFDVGSNRVGRRKWYAVSSGSFLGYERYAAQRGYSPGRLGAPRIFLDGKRHDLHVSI